MQSAPHPNLSSIVTKAPLGHRWRCAARAHGRERSVERGESLMQQIMEYPQTAPRAWTTRRDEKRRRMQLVQPWMKGPVLPTARVIEALETLIVSADRIVLEGDNQKQADFLSRSLVK